MILDLELYSNFHQINFYKLNLDCINNITTKAGTVIFLIIILQTNFLNAQFNSNSFGKLQSRVFFISNTGDDSNSGTSENNAWRTIQKVSSFKFKPGDIIQFRGGDLFTGNK